MDGNNTVVIRLLGRFSVEYCGRVLMEPEGVRESQSWRLLKYLCVNYKRATDMDELTKALCLDCGDVNVWNTIRVRLRRTRAILDRVGLGDTQNGLLLYGAGKYWINHDLELLVDTGEVERLFALAQNPARPETLRLAESLSAIGLYRGRFLAFSEPSGRTDAIRERYDLIYSRLVEFSLALMAQTGNYKGAPSVCDSLLRVSPLDVRLHCLILKTLLSAGLVGESATYYSKVAVALANTGAELPDFMSLMSEAKAKVKPGGTA